MSLVLERKLRRQGRSYYSEAELKTLLPGTRNSQKAIIKRAVAEGLLIRLKRGLYCVNGEVSQKKPHAFELAQLIYGPSFISLESALSYHGLIPEAVYTTTSVTIKRKKTFHTPLGEFDFHKVPKKNFLVGVERIADGKAIFFIASPWRALTDYVYCYKKTWESFFALKNDLRLTTENVPKITKLFANDLQEYYQNKYVDIFLDTIFKRSTNGH